MAPSPLRILILEDIPMDAELVEYELGRAGIPFTALRVDDRDTFALQLLEFRPQLILSDYSLPAFDGMAALSLARERVPAIPFIIVTGSINEETAVGCMKAGASDYLLKSNLARIGPAIEGALARSRLYSEQARAQTALRRSEANLRAIFNNSLQCFVLVDRDGTIQAFNRTAEEWAQRILGRRPREGESIQGFIPQAVPVFERALGGETFTEELNLRDAEGVERWFETTNAPVVDDDGSVIGVCLNARDISGRKASERALRESEERYRDLFDSANDLVCVASPEGVFLYVNKAWHESIGYSDDELRRLTLLDVVHPDSRQRYSQALTRVLAGENVNHLELVFLTSAGVSITVEGNLSRTASVVEAGMVRGIFRDVTERKRVEEHLRRAERMQAAGRLAGGVAHEVNNMMTGVIGFSQFLLDDLELDDPRRAEVKEIIKAGNRAADVTRQLLAFTRQQLLRPEVLDVNVVVENLEKMLRRSLGAEHTLDLRLGPDTGRIRADGGQLEQVLINLVLNARDAMNGRGRVTIATQRATLDEVYAQRHDTVTVPPGPYVRLEVTDTGCGMTRDVQARIFEPFFTTKGVGQGTGLGLSTVYGIVKQSGGFIWVYSEPDQGSAFKIYLPETETPSNEGVMRDPVVTTGSGSETILIIEDEEIVRHLTCRGLRANGYEVIEAVNGEEGLRRVAENPHRINLVVCDVVMPGMGGREVGARLARSEPELPILYISGYTGDDVVQRGLLEAGSPFQQKPFTADGLARTIRQMLDRPGVTAATAMRVIK
jgi:two-component system cell cycle sensor histidine kinase/response regulator CckA